jgi:glutamine synthetase
MDRALEARLQEFGAEVVHVGQFDYASIFRERRLRKEQFLSWALDPRFANVLAYWDTNDILYGGSKYYTETQTIDPDSIRRYPREPNAVAVIAEMAGGTKELMPRYVLRRQVERARAMGYAVQAAFEFEFILLRENDVSVRERGFDNLANFAPDNKCWSGTTAATHAELVAQLEAEIEGFDVNLFGLGVELGAGCFEATLGAVDGLRAADDAAFFRLATRCFAREQGLTASFMPYLGNGYPGLGGHITLSLRDLSSGENLFSDADGKTNALARAFIAGLIDLVPEAFAMCTSSVNAYRRLVPGTWGPKAATWAEHTFTTAVRSVPFAGDLARIEFRSPPADCNPYLTMALMLGAGLDGIERDLTAPPAAEAAGPADVAGSGQRFPRDLIEAAEWLERSEAVRRIFGEAFIANFASACRAEDATLKTAVSADERRRYLEA